MNCWLSKLRIWTYASEFILLENPMIANHNHTFTGNSTMKYSYPCKTKIVWDVAWNNVHSCVMDGLHWNYYVSLSEYLLIGKHKNVSTFHHSYCSVMQIANDKLW